MLPRSSELFSHEAPPIGDVRAGSGYWESRKSRGGSSCGFHKLFSLNGTTSTGTDGTPRPTGVNLFLAEGQNIKVAVDEGGDDWETDPDFEVPIFTTSFLLLSYCSMCLRFYFWDFFQNDVSEKEQRWGAKTVAGSGHQEHIELGRNDLHPIYYMLLDIS
ncbi:hypothetical protein GOODEAATRI_021282 [Goodea atripinnis]|uniref:Uncharacterized protein n=1 Tax=Goodea atripinnis TaxID=208336 RepID=A0ABV0NY90_9TELE